MLGGDGTCRLASKTSGEVPLLPISSGTNNVVPNFIEGTVAGLAAAYVAQHAEKDIAKLDLCWRHKRLIVKVNGEGVDQALVDRCGCEHRFCGIESGLGRGPHQAGLRDARRSGEHWDFIGDRYGPEGRP